MGWREVSDCIHGMCIDQLVAYLCLPPKVLGEFQVSLSSRPLQGSEGSH